MPTDRAGRLRVARRDAQGYPMMVKDYPELPRLPEADSAEQCSLKLWRLRALFAQLAHDWSLTSEICRGWPGLALCRRRLFVERSLELRLQSDYLLDGREFYEIRFLEKRPGWTGGRTRHDFGCGRLLADEVLSEGRVVRQIAEKARLLGLVGETKAMRGLPAGARRTPNLRGRRRGSDKRQPETIA